MATVVGLNQHFYPALYKPENGITNFGPVKDMESQWNKDFNKVFERLLPINQHGCALYITFQIAED